MLRNYLKIAWKVLKRNPFFTFVSLFGISLTIAILLVLAALIDHALGAHYPETFRDRTLNVLRVRMDNGKDGSWQEQASFYYLDHYVKQLKTPEVVALISHGELTNTFVGNKKLSLTLKYTCENFWKANDFDFLEGRPYDKQQIDNNEYVAVISEATRDAYFGKGQKAAGQWIETDNTRYRVSGVVRNVSQARFITFSDIYAPYNTSKSNLEEKIFLGPYFGIILARSKSDLPRIREEFQSMVTRIEIPPLEDWRKEYKFLVSKVSTPYEMIASTVFGEDNSPVAKLTAILVTAMVLFMSLPALNLVNLNSSRIMERSSEIGVRKAFGATSSTLVVQFIVENILLTLVGGIIALVLAAGILEWVEGSGLIPYASLSINFRIFLVAVILCFFFGILSGVLPAFQMSKLKIVNALKDHEL